MVAFPGTSYCALRHNPQGNGIALSVSRQPSAPSPAGFVFLRLKYSGRGHSRMKPGATIRQMAAAQPFTFPATYSLTLAIYDDDERRDCLVYGTFRFRKDNRRNART
jgi:hypothetical protein